MKKTMALVITLLLIISALAVMAQEDQNQGGQDQSEVNANLGVSAGVSTENSDQDTSTNASSNAEVNAGMRQERRDARDVRKEERNELRANLKEAREKLREDREELKADRTEFRNTILEKRAETRNKLMGLRTATKESRQEFLSGQAKIRLEAKQQREELRKEAESAREQLKSEKQEIRVTAAKELMTVTALHADKLLEQLSAELAQAQAENNDSVSEVISARMDAIAQLRVTLADAQEKISALNATSTKEQIKAVLGKMRENLKEVRAELGLGIEHQAFAQFHGVFAKFRAAEKRIEQLIERAEKKGIAKEAYASATATIKETLVAGTASLTHAQDALRENKKDEAHTLLKQAQETAKKAFELIKNLHAKIQAQVRASVNAREANDILSEAEENASVNSSVNASTNNSAGGLA